MRATCTRPATGRGHRASRHDRGSGIARNMRSCPRPRPAASRSQAPDEIGVEQRASRRGQQGQVAGARPGRDPASGSTPRMQSGRPAGSRSVSPRQAAAPAPIASGMPGGAVMPAQRHDRALIGARGGGEMADPAPCHPRPAARDRPSRHSGGRSQDAGSRHAGCRRGDAGPAWRRTGGSPPEALRLSSTSRMVTANKHWRRLAWGGWPVRRDHDFATPDRGRARAAKEPRNDRPTSGMVPGGHDGPSLGDGYATVNRRPPAELARRRAWSGSGTAARAHCRARTCRPGRGRHR